MEAERVKRERSHHIPFLEDGGCQTVVLTGREGGEVLPLNEYENIDEYLGIDTLNGDSHLKVTAELLSISE